jgi:hypothetical protein
MLPLAAAKNFNFFSEREASGKKGVILSGAGTSRSEAPAESKDPYIFSAVRTRQGILPVHRLSEREGHEFTRAIKSSKMYPRFSARGALSAASAHSAEKLDFDFGWRSGSPLR